MAIEIERKFLVSSDAWRDAARSRSTLRQGYLNREGPASVRVRTSDEHAWLNIKSRELGVSRREYEYPMPVADADEMLGDLCQGPLVEKIRYEVPVDGHVWEVDEFLGDNAGLVVAEIELSQADEAFTPPPWLGREVTDESRYYNMNLSTRPYCRWGDEERKP